MKDKHDVNTTRNAVILTASADEQPHAEVDGLFEPSWYHDFSLLGLKTPQRGGIFPPNQKCKQAILFPLIDEAVRLARKSGGKLRGIELFCADGYYGMYAMRRGIDSLRGIDLNEAELAHARAAAKILGWGDKITFEAEDVYQLSGDYDFCICAGGLYHLSDPGRLLSDLARKVHGPLVVQTVISLANTMPDYFESPAPGWTWGSRFSYGYLQDLMAKTGWEIIDYSEGTLSGNERLEDRGSAYLLCVPPSYVQSGIAKKRFYKTDEKLNIPKDGILYNQPNKYARPSGLELGPETLIHGYQEFKLTSNTIESLPQDPPLLRKRQLLSPIFDSDFLADKTLLDLGANGGFFSFWARQRGAKSVVALDMDENYIRLINTAREHFGISGIRTVSGRAQDWEEPADVVLAFALVHWLFSCTATYGSLDAVVCKLRSLTKELLVIEWVAPEDTAITSFKHTDWNPSVIRDSYTLPAFEAALRRHFARTEIVGPTSGSRVLYLAWCRPREITLAAELPLRAPAERLISSRCLVEFEGKKYFSQVYFGEDGQSISKQATGDLAWRDAEFLRRLAGPHFPRVLEARQEDGWSAAVFERIAGQELTQVIPQIAANPKALATFFGECLDILEALQAAGITHRDIQTHNLLVRDGHPVLIDFGWAVTADLPCFDPAGLGDSGRPPDGSFCDVYAMGKVFSVCAPVNEPVFAPLIAAMTAADLARRTTAVASLRKMLNDLVLPATWEKLPTFVPTRRHDDPLPWREYVSSLLARVNALIATGKVAAAGSLLETGILIQPESPELRALFGEILLQQDQKEVAAAQFAAAYRLDPANATAGKFLASTLIALHRIREAADVLKNLLELDPNDTVVLCATASCLAQAGQINPAVQAYQRVLELDPANAQARQAIVQLGGDVPCAAAPVPLTSASNAQLTSLPGPHPLEIFPVGSRAAFEQLYQTRLGPAFREQQQFVPAEQKPFTLPGYCAVCGREQKFMTDFLYASPDANGRLMPSWRERQMCQCGLNSRQRACFHVLAEGLGLAESSLIYCTEQQGALFHLIGERFPFTLGSEFLGDAIPLGKTDARGIRNEDLTRLTYPDDSFDCIVSLEVLEHIPDYRAALGELARCLKPGGRLLLTTPIHFKKDATVVRAGFGAVGQLIHHLPPVYHGDPINAGGALCFNDFGWDLLEDLKQAGFPDAAPHFFTSREYGYLGMHCVVLGRRERVLKNRSPRRAKPPTLAPAKPAAVTPPAEPTEVLWERARQLSAARNWIAAGEVYQTLCHRLPDDLAVWRGRVECSRQLGHAVLANLILTEALRHHPEWTSVLSETTGTTREEKNPQAQPAAPEPVVPAVAELETVRPKNRPDAETQTGAAPKVSIIIPVLNKVAFTRKCLKALKRNTPADLYEVIVWDNGSTDETPQFFQQHAADEKMIRYFRSEENLGFVGGNNAAVQHAHGEFLVFLNNDTEPQPGWLEALLQPAEAEATVGAVGAKLIYPDGKLQEAGGIIFRDASGWNYGRTLHPRDPRFNFPREVDYCSAACLLVRTALFRQLGGFDVRYAPAYYEDTDLCFALRQNGHRVVYQPRCEIIHYEGATAGQDLTKGFKKYQAVNRQKFFDKWQQALMRQAAPDASGVRRASHRVRGQRILVIDPLMPMYDRASGSKRLFEMLKLLAHGGHAVTFIARNGQEGERYATELQQLGIEVYAGDAERMKECGFNVKGWPLDLKQLLQDTQYDTVILSFWYIAEQYMSRIRVWSPKSRVVIDTVDVHFLRELRQAELYQDHKLVLQAKDTLKRELGIYRRADALITVTEDDRQVLLKQIPQSRIFIVPNIHDVATEVPPVDGRCGCLFVGGFNHLPNADAVLFFHREIWPRILQRLPDARWTIVGNNPPPAVQALAGPNIEVTGYVPSVEPYLRSHLVSVAPLRYGAGMKGKIGEALANGLPVVTTPIGAEGMGLQNGVGGTLVAEKPEAFADHVVRLHADRAFWNHLSVQGRQHIESHFTPACIARKLEAILDWSSSFTSIILLALNQWEHTEKCLLSIVRHTPEPHEIILVDNGSTDKTPEALRVLAVKHPRVRVIVNRDNRGFAAGNNQALAVACGDAVVLLNNDTVVTPGWLGRMLAVFQREPETGLVGPMSNRVSGPQFVGAVGYTDLDGLPAFAEQWAAANAGQSFEVARAVGFCLLARREVISRIGGLDEQFGNGNFEDDDYCIRARLAGFRIQIAKDVFIHHTGSQTFRGAKIDYRQAMLRNWDIFRAKWEFPAEVTLERGYPMPRQLPKNVALKLPLPALAATHLYDGSRWMDKKKFSAAAGPVKPAPVAEIGRLDEARELFGQKNYPAAWAAGLVALSKRPFHPEACLLLAEIAQAVGDGQTAKRCAQRAREFAPGWIAAKQFLSKPLKGDAKLDWLNASCLATRAPRLSVCLIVKNEEQFLAQCLKSIRGFASQIVVVDTGSNDRTVEIAREFGAEIYSFAWCDDFAAARNAALEHATGDWVLMLDADEELPAAQHAMLVADMKNSNVIAFRLPLVNVGHENEGRSFVPRLFRNAPGVFFHGRIHEQVFSSLLVHAKKWGLKTALGTAEILHHGYTKEMVRDRNKVARNLKLLHAAIEENPADVNLVMNLGLELVRSDDLAGGIEKYREAYAMMSAQPAEEIVPELREVLLTQFTSQLYKVQGHAEVLQVLNSPLARRGGLTASLHFALGLAHFELKQFREAADQMRQCLAKRKQPGLTPINTDTLTAAPSHCLALSLAKLGDQSGAEKAFTAALAETSHAGAAKLDYAKFLQEQNRPVDALHQLHEIVTASARNFAAWRLGGEIALSKPEFLEFARDWTGEAFRALPENPVIAAHRAEALMLNGEPAAAVDLWEKIWRSEPDPRALAALILCETAGARTAHAPNANDEPATSRAFIEWYQKLIAVRAQTLLGAINERLDLLSRVLPTAAQMLATALSEAEAPAAV